MARLSYFYCFLILPVIALPITAQPTAPKPVDPVSVDWASIPSIPGLRFAWLLGGEKQSVPYALRVQLSKDGVIPPHTHPDSRHTTVLSGTLYVGFGAEFDQTNMVAVHAGSLYVAPADVPHYLWAKEGNVVYQESGTGPTGNHFLYPPSSAP